MAERRPSHGSASGVGRGWRHDGRRRHHRGQCHRHLCGHLHRARIPAVRGGAITVASAIVIFVAISIGLVSLQSGAEPDSNVGGHGVCEDLGFKYWGPSTALTRGTAKATAPCRGRRGDGTAGSNGATRTRGVDPELLRSLPVTVYVYRAAVPGSKVDAAECSVCLVELEDGEEARFLPCCGHGFHAECVDMWLASHTTRPLCRLTVSKPDPDSSQTPTPASALRPLPPEPANLPRSVLLGVSDQGAVTAVNMTSDDGDDTTASASTAAAPVPVIEIPELAPVPTPTPRDAAKSSPVSARPRSFRRLWSFGRQGPSSSSSCTSGGAGEVADVEQGISVTVGMAVSEAQLPSEATRPVRPRDLLCSDGPPDVRQAD
ncbi:unnamed protein product [Miscanthus lutarioriparius]|uniref:RING-type E3 ubiquitin transferase n=1 Tax=Miscanthus lutarioriparius TaxID=422564 RepID=A0A811SMR3_9POAL|nr:unnamed protein product [Miscanthus lutarioriparius]